MGNRPSRGLRHTDVLTRSLPVNSNQNVTAVYGNGHSRFTHSISCPSRDNPNAIVRVSEYSKSTTSHNESIVSISLEEQGDFSPLYTETPEEYSTSEASCSESASFSGEEEEEDESFTPSSAPNYFEEMEASDRHTRLEQYREGSQGSNGRSKPEEFEFLNAPSTCVEGTGLESEHAAIPGKGDKEGGDAIDAIQVYNATLQSIFTIPEQKSEHVSSADEEDAMRVYSVTLQGIFSITDLEGGREAVGGEETVDVTQDDAPASPTLEGVSTSVPVERAKEEEGVLEVLPASQGITSDHCDTYTQQADGHIAVLEAGQSCNSEDSNNIEVMLTTSQDQPDGGQPDGGQPDGGQPDEGLSSPQEAGNTVDIYDVRFCGIVSYCADTLTQDSVTSIGNPP